MKIAIARGPGQFGGVFRRFRELCAYSAGRHDVFGLLPFSMSDGQVSLPVRTYCYDRRRLPWRVARAASVSELLDSCEGMVSAIADDLRRERPDRVLACGTDLKGVTVIAAAREVGCPVTTFVAGFEAQESVFDRRGVRPATLLAEQFCLETSDRLIFPSQFAANHAAARVRAMAPSTVVHNGIAAPFLDDVAPTPDAAAAGAVMRLDPVKNPETLDRIGLALRAHDIRLDLVTEVRSDAPVPLQGVRILPPTLDTYALAHQLRQWRAVVAPSRFEASGNVPMEALAVGTPAVVTDQMGVAEIFRDLGLGHLVVPVDDVDLTVDLVRHAQAVPDAVRATIRHTFSWPTVAERLIAAL